MGFSFGVKGPEGEGLSHVAFRFSTGEFPRHRGFEAINPKPYAPNPTTAKALKPKPKRGFEMSKL